jgi:hypothetical protein
MKQSIVNGIILLLIPIAAVQAERRSGMQWQSAKVVHSLATGQLEIQLGGGSMSTSSLVGIRIVEDDKVSIEGVEVRSRVKRSGPGSWRNVVNEPEEITATRAGSINAADRRIALADNGLPDHRNLYLVGVPRGMHVIISREGRKIISGFDLDQILIRGEDVQIASIQGMHHLIVLSLMGVNGTTSAVAPKTLAVTGQQTLDVESAVKLLVSAEPLCKRTQVGESGRYVCTAMILFGANGNVSHISGTPTAETELVTALKSIRIQPGARNRLLRLPIFVNETGSFISALHSK